MKTLLSISLVLSMSIAMGQSKKELRQSISDLNMQKTVLESRINKKDSLIANINLKLKTTEEQLSKAELDIQNLGESFSEATLENLNLSSEIKKLNQTIEELSSAKSSKLVYLKYENQINGYNVSMSWNPVIKRGKHFIGPGIIFFDHPNKENSFSIGHQFLSILEKDVPFIKVNESDANFEVSQSQASLKYDNRSTTNSNPFKIDEVPFFFKDIDLSNYTKEELVLLEKGTGTRERNSFKVYEVSPYSIRELKHEPYTNLEDTSKIDYSKRTITNYFDVGHCADAYEIYGFEKIDEYSEYFKLRYTIEQKMDRNGKCYWNTYKVGDVNRTFIRKSISN